MYRGAEYLVRAAAWACACMKSNAVWCGQGRLRQDKERSKILSATLWSLPHTFRAFPSILYCYYFLIQTAHCILEPRRSIVLSLGGQDHKITRLVPLSSTTICQIRTPRLQTAESGMVAPSYVNVACAHSCRLCISGHVLTAALASKFI